MLLTPNELRTIHAIADRAVTLMEQLELLDPRNVRFGRSGIAHELMTVHTEIIPLRLEDMLKGADADLMHDVGGIHRHLDYGKRRQKPQLTLCFLPRFARC
jgi:hypothetical protein